MGVPIFRSVPMIRFARLWQPRHPAFWLMLVLNALSTLLAWMVRNIDLTPLAAVAVVVFALGNAGLGLALLARLLRTPRADEAAVRR